MNIKSLIEIFSEHEIQARENNQQLLKMFIQDNPGKTPPSYLTDEFYLPAALKFMCEEIAAIKLKAGMQ